MRRKITPTILERAIIEVPDFENVIKKLSEQVDLRGQSKSTLKNYSSSFISLLQYKTFQKQAKHSISA